MISCVLAPIGNPLLIESLNNSKEVNKMPSPKRSKVEKYSIVQGGGRLNVKNPISKKEQEKGPRKTKYRPKC
jgi:hypothetical protein